jgi:hypothetical protein
MASERRLLKWAVLKMWTPRQGSPRNLGLAVAQQLSVPIRIPNCVWLAVALTEWQRVGNQIDAAFILARAHFVNVCRSWRCHNRKRNCWIRDIGAR